METSTFLYEGNNPNWAKNEYPDDNYSDYNYKFSAKKVLFRLQSPIYESNQECEGSGSYDMEFQEPTSSKLEDTNDSLEKCSENSKKTKKDIKLKVKSERLLSESEFIGIMKQIEQCQQVQDLIDNMASVLKGFQVQIKRSQCFKRVK